MVRCFNNGIECDFNGIPLHPLIGRWDIDDDYDAEFNYISEQQ
jgi:hypothetical protein